MVWECEKSLNWEWEWVVWVWEGVDEGSGNVKSHSRPFLEQTHQLTTANKTNDFIAATSTKLWA